jgi:hypothetical protein
MIPPLGTTTYPIVTHNEAEAEKEEAAASLSAHLFDTVSQLRASRLIVPLRSASHQIVPDAAVPHPVMVGHHPFTRAGDDDGGR